MAEYTELSTAVSYIWFIIDTERSYLGINMATYTELSTAVSYIWFIIDTERSYPLQ
jgi:hypothetical protein